MWAVCFDNQEQRIWFRNGLVINVHRDIKDHLIINETSVECSLKLFRRYQCLNRLKINYIADLVPKPYSKRVLLEAVEERLDRLSKTRYRSESTSQQSS